MRPGDGPPSPDYPVQLEFDRQESYHRFLPLVKWLLAIPHFFVFFFFVIGAFFAVIGAFFAVLFTGKYPPGILNFLVGVGRYGQRLNAYVCLLTDAYPSFSLGEDPEYPVRFAIEPPGEIARWRPLVHWLLVIPYYIVGSILATIWIYVITIIAFFTILFTKNYPQPLFDFAVVAQRWSARAGAYMFWMTGRYPPWVYA